MTEEKDGQAEGTGFRVTDRRSFDASGERRSEETEAETSPPSSGPEAEPAEPVRYPVSFRVMLARFSIEALIHLGVEPNPETGERQVDLDAARLPIDLLSLLEEKTRGNLDADEAKELQDVLYQLRMLYVERSSGDPS